MKTLLASASLLLLATLLSTPAVAAPPTPGALVLAPWGSDGAFYPGRVAEVEGKHARIAFYDGDVAVIDVAKVRAFDWKVGSRVQCKWKGGAKYYKGAIAKMVGEAIGILYDDGDKEEAGIGRCRELTRAL